MTNTLGTLGPAPDEPPQTTPGTASLSRSVAAELDAGLHAICATAGLDHHQAVLVKFTMNAVYATDSLILRLARGPGARRKAAKLVALMQVLAGTDAPVIRLAPGIVQPVNAEDWTATIWQRVPVGPAVPGPASLADPLRRFHELRSLELNDGLIALNAGPLPDWSPVDKTLTRIAATKELPDREAEATEHWALEQLGMPLVDLTDWLTARALRLADLLQSITWSLPTGPIHADAHTGNLLISKTGQALLCDLDGICHGPREWDLVPSAHGTERFGRSHSAYQTFAETYGFDVTAWEGWPALRDARDLQLVTSVLPAITGRPQVATELSRRLLSIIDPHQSATWTRYS